MIFSGYFSGIKGMFKKHINLAPLIFQRVIGRSVVE